ncbi:Patatin-like phospholipase [Seminavis robusta]|uniref:Patatin-like phospholipase n=1 Tax=Seminavis robusta TaxID=568900 RepID=A0A9N8D6N4_9STRA|nr:Patatin-like phospholipase [Seminavis robusta]|eukprot:Sro2_g001760.1 Patatin-like phospholipase (837) ;mRNA; f:240453-243051
MSTGLSSVVFNKSVVGGVGATPIIKRISRISWKMVALLLILFLCITDAAIRPSPGGVGGNKVAARRPLPRLWYRRFEEGSVEDAGRRIPRLDQLRNKKSEKTPYPRGFAVDLSLLPEEQTISREALASELTTLLQGIESIANDLDRGVFPPLGIATGAAEDIVTGAAKDATSRKPKKQSTTKADKLQKIKTVQELRQAVLDDGKELKELQLDPEAQLLVNATAQELLNHDVVELMVQRFKSGSTPGNRAPGDNARLALAIEGGGMRGAVSAGMASAIACLGLHDTFDAIYGSSAGSVVGSYMISRQMCMDVYVDILPAAKRTFVCTKRIMSALAVTAMNMFLSGVKQRATRMGSKNTSAEDNEKTKGFASKLSPGMNISFVLDGIMGPEHGIRPIDMEAFQRNAKMQPLRVASSYAKDGKLYSRCFGSEDFFGDKRAVREDGTREGLFACLEPSMTVPGATGPPSRLKTHGSDDEAIPYFDAFCFEPLPYRSAVEEGATHVLVLCSRPEGFVPKTKPGVYEQAIAPLYFKSHGEPEVADFFYRGGQLYIYLEDLLTVEEGKVAGMKKQGPVSVPPPRLLYGVDADHENRELATHRDEKWKKAHLLPLKVPFGTPELKTLEQEKDTVREAVKGGFAAAFDLLAPAIGLNTHHHLTGAEVAALIFPKKAGMLDEIILREKLRIDGVHIEHREHHHSSTTETTQEVGKASSGRRRRRNRASPQEVDKTPSGRRRRIRARRDRFLRNARHVLSILARNKRISEANNEKERMEHSIDSLLVVPDLTLHGGGTLDNDKQKAEHLLNSLPGLRYGRMPQLAANLHHVASSPETITTNDETRKA